MRRLAHSAQICFCLPIVRWFFTNLRLVVTTASHESGAPISADVATVYLGDHDRDVLRFRDLIVDHPTDSSVRIEFLNGHVRMQCNDPQLQHEIII